MTALGPDLPDVGRAVVLGLARSGQAAVAALVERDVRVVASDLRPEGAIEGLERRDGVAYVLGGHPGSLLDEADLVVLSPGVPAGLPLARAAAARGVPVIPEIELAARLLSGPVVGITGTNGKSTTTSLCAALIRESGKPAIACGNLGTPWVAYATAARAREARDGPVWVVELSSFQLETTRLFAPDVAVHLNLTPDHLDRHGSMEAYAAAKARVFAHQRADQLAVLNADDVPVRAIPVRARRAAFSRQAVPDLGTWLDARGFHANLGGSPERFAGRSDLALPGAHNEENALAALAAAIPFGVGPAAAVRAFRGAVPLPHRLALVRVVGGVSYYDDSKGTNVDAALKSLEGMPDGRVLAILGGKTKNDDFGRMRPMLSRKARLVLAIGAAQDEIAAALKGAVPVVAAGTLAAAVARAGEAARSGDVVLLSPACASFDQFRDFEHRGEVFQDLVRALPERPAGRVASEGPS
jgi:UDP-N-acetylmuramoylalanine--D-glutamate ligase